MIDERAYELLCCQLGLANEEKAGLRKHRNKVSVGEPAEGSLKKFNNFENGFFFLFWQEHESFYWARRQEMESPAGPALKCAVLLGL